MRRGNVLRYNQLHWATPLSINIIVEEALTKEVYLVTDEKNSVIATFNMSESPSMYFDTDKKQCISRDWV